MKSNKPLTVQFGLRVAALRRRLDMTQEVLAEKTDIRQESLSRMEKGIIAPRFERLQSFADALGCSVADLFYTTETKRQDEPLDDMLASLSEEERQDISTILHSIIQFASRRRL